MTCKLSGEIKAVQPLSGEIKENHTLSADMSICFSDGGSGMNYIIGDGLKVEGRVLSVDTTNVVEEDNTKPVTSVAVHVQLGNVEALLKSI